MNSKLNEKEFGKFEDYVEHLNKYVYASNTITRLKLVLDGEPSRQYRNHLSIQLRRKNGAFFSSQHLANEIFKRANKYLNQNSRIIDPTCGIGSLLLPFAAQISIDRKSVV
jgi:tRNA/tmRNA/rRNA uracil-C5-methylase (TrmA/RlmC/RlmD family)